MSYSLSKIDPTLTEEKLKKYVEGQYFDRKSARLSQKELARHISAFANANGGVVALGIEDNGDVTGIELHTFRFLRFSAIPLMSVLSNNISIFNTCHSLLYPSFLSCKG